MKIYFAVKSLLLTFSLLSMCAHGANKYVSVSGNDSNNGSITAPYKTVAKVNTIFNTLNPGDSVLFKRGETFYGTLSISKSGTASQPIVIGAYGEGSKPILTGMVTLDTWTLVGNGIYESHNSAFNGAINMVVVNDEVQGMGRYPNVDNGNDGYLNFETHVSNASITDVQFIGTTNYVGAELVIRTNRYIIDRTKIVGHVGTTLTYSPALSYEPSNGFGFFIQNDIRTLDKLGEWFFNPTAKKLLMYFGSYNPSAYTVRASAINNTVYVSNYDNIVFDNLQIIGGNNYSIYVYSANNIVVSNCDIDFSGIDGMEINSANNFKGYNNTINRSNNIGINLNASINGTIINNKVTNTALVKGLGQNHANKSLGVRETGNHNLIEYNEVINTGYMGIRFGGDNTTIKNNYVRYFNLNKDDGGGIYTSDNGIAKKILGNIVMDGYGAPFGTSSSTFGSTYGIYIDDYSNNVEVSDNSIASCSKAGILIHNAVNISLNRNTVFNNSGYQLLMSHNLTKATAPPIRNIVFKGNTLFAKTADQGAINILTVKNDVSLAAGIMDSNYYCRPLDDNYVIHTQYVDNAGKTILQDFDLPLWQNTYSKDAHSNVTSARIIDYTLSSLIGGNKFLNGTFIKNIVGVNFGSTGTAVKSWNANKLDGGTLQIAVSSSKPCMSTATIPILGVSTSKKYIIRFTAQSSKDTMLYVYARQAASPYKVLSNNGSKTIVNISNIRKDYAVAFEPTINNASTSIFFETPVQNGTFWLDNIEIYEADLTLTNPDDSIRLEYNPSQTEVLRSLPGMYTDEKGNKYNGRVALQPYTSVILIRTGDIYIPPPPPPPTDTLPTVSLVNNDPDTATTPTTIHLTAVTKAHNGVRKVEFFNGVHLVYTAWSAPYNFSWVNIPIGTYSFTARIQDKHLNLARSSPVLVLVRKTQ